MDVTEYGRLVYVERPIDDPNWVMVEADVRQILDANYAQTKLEMPDIDWPDEYTFRVTDTFPVPVFVRCSGCEGVGIAQGRYAVPCEKCTGSGQEYIGISDKRIARQYAWYVSIPE